MPNLIWVDLETTGLDEKRVGASILEIGMLVTELPMFKIVAAFEVLIVPDMLDEDGADWEDICEPNALDMHRASGLIAACEAAGSSQAGAIRAAEMFFVEHLGHTANWWTPMAGANPDFDRRWLRQHGPDLEKLFHYRNFDVRSITQLQTWCGGGGFAIPRIATKHRALADCEEAVQATRRFLGL